MCNQIAYLSFLQKYMRQQSKLSHVQNCAYEIYVAKK